jgi:hypothetical protein
MPIQVLKMTETLAIVKVSGGGGTIDLATDLLSSTMIIEGTPTVNITYAQWNISGGVGDKIAVVRNAVTILNLQQNAGELDMGGNGGYSDNTHNTFNIVVTTTGVGEVYLTLRKVAGYRSKVELAQFGQYDNPAAVGS